MQSSSITVRPSSLKLINQSINLFAFLNVLLMQMFGIDFYSMALINTVWHWSFQYGIAIIDECPAVALDHFEVTIVGFSVLLDHDRILENLTVGIIKKILEYSWHLIFGRKTWTHLEQNFQILNINVKGGLLDNHLVAMSELVDRDKNRPSVIMWSVGNEPRSYKWDW